MADSAKKPRPKRQKSKRADGVDRASDVEPKPIEWLWLNRIPKGMISLMAGRPDQGKSLFMAFLTAEVTRNGGNVIFSNLEDSPAHVIRPRLEAAGAVLDRVHFWHPILPRDSDKLRDMVEKLDAKLVVFDPVAAHLTVSIYQDQGVRQALTPLTKIASDTGCAMFLVHHTVKNAGKTSHPLAAVGGSGGGLPGSARVVFIFGVNPDGEDERALVPIKFNIAPTPKSVTFEIDEADANRGGQIIKTGRLIMLQDDAAINATKVLMHTGDGAVNAEKRAIAAEWLTDYLADGAQKATDLQHAANVEGIAWRTIRRAAEEISIIKKRVGFGPGSHITWELPPDHPALSSGG